MKKNMLLIGKDFLEDEGFALYCKEQNCSFVYTTKALDLAEKDENTFEGTKICVPWNGASSLSSKNFLIRSESALGNIDRAVLYFDTVYFSSYYAHVEKNRIQTIADELIMGFQKMTDILLERFKEKKQGGFVFLLKEATPPFKAMKGQEEMFCPYLYAAQEAFVAFSEMIAYQYAHKLSNSIVLARTKLKDDAEIAALLCNRLNSEKFVKKLPKDALRWVLLQNQSEGVLRFLK